LRNYFIAVDLLYNLVDLGLVQPVMLLPAFPGMMGMLKRRLAYALGFHAGNKPDRRMLETPRLMFPHVSSQRTSQATDHHRGHTSASSRV
jgi:hypothetical protein